MFGRRRGCGWQRSDSRSKACGTGRGAARKVSLSPFSRHLAIEPLEQCALLSVGPLLADTPMLQPAADTIPPTIVSTTPSLDGGTLNVANLTLAITFSESVVHYAANASYYLLQSAGADGFLGTADDVLTHPGVTYSGTTATLHFTTFSEGVYRLTVYDAITDTSANKLDGDGDGIAGGNWTTDFVAVRDGFAAPVTYLTGSGNLYDVATADLNVDGNLDLVVTKGVVAVLLGNGDGTFLAASTFSSGGTQPYGPTIGDFNGDLKPDVAVVNLYSGTVGVLLGDGMGGFSPVVTYAAGGWYPSDLTTGDFNSDGKLDLALVHSEAPGTFGVLLGNGDGTFQPVTTFSSGGNYAYAIVTADFNGDGVLDLAATNHGSATVAICLGDGAGGFSAATTMASGGSSPDYLDAGDFDGDGNLDLVVANYGSSNIGVLLGNGDGTFKSVTTYTTNATYPDGIVVGDVNGDGKYDILASTSAGLSLLLGEGNGTFAPSAIYSTGGASSVTALGDFDGDGDLDAAVAIGRSVAVLRNTFNEVWTTFGSPHGLPFDVSFNCLGAGELLQGYHNAFDGDGRLLVGGVTFEPANASYSLTDAGQSIVTADATLARLTVRRKVTVPNTGNEDFARTVDTFTNSTASAITTTVTIVGNLGSDGATWVFTTSDGDTIVEPTDLWFGTDGGPGTPAVIHIIQGPAASLRPTAAHVTGDNVSWTYQTTVAAGETVRLGYFTIVADTREAAISAAAALIVPGGFGGQAAAFLSPEEEQSWGNFLNTNQAPVLAAATPYLGEIDEDWPLTLDLSAGFINHGAGTTTITDPDAGATLGGIAIVTATGNGVWYYSLDGKVYQPMGTVSDSEALLLPNTARLRYTPDRTGVETATITYRAWDATLGMPGSKIATAVNGGTTAFSTATDTASLSVISVNDAPVLTPAEPLLATSDQNTPLTFDLADFINHGAGTTLITDVDQGAIVGGIALVRTVGRGEWSYSLDGVNFSPVDAVTAHAALLVPASAKLSYTPGVLGEIASIVYRAWDTTSGTAGDRVEASIGGGATAFSLATDTAAIALLTGPLIVRTTPSLTSGVVNVGDTQIAIDFSGTVLGADTAANYHLQGVGADGLLGTADDPIIPATVSYAGVTATLTFGALAEDVYRLTVYDAITDLAGMRLDGDADGVPGGNWTMDFVGTINIFSAVTDNLSIGGAYDFASVDLNADGNLDLIAVSGAVATLLGNGNGTFSPARFFGSGGRQPYGPTVGDFNADGRPDVAVANAFDGTIGVLLGDNMGGFLHPIVYEAGGYGSSDMASGDFDRDGNLDLAVANESNSRVGIFLGNGDGTFRPVTTFSSGGSDPWFLVAADFNGDCNLDLAVTNNHSDNLAVFLGNGSGDFSTPITTSTGGAYPRDFDAGDVNGDGKIDLVIANHGNDSVGVLLGNDDGTFQPPIVYATGPAPNAARIGDINMDGKPDIVVGISTGLEVLLNRGDGSFVAAGICNTGGFTYAAALGDFDGDGDLDAAAAGGPVAVLLNNTNSAWTTLMSPHSVPFDVAEGDVGAGQLLQGYNNAFDGYGRLMIDGMPFQPNSAHLSTADSGQSLVTASGTAAGLTVSREVTVPNTGNEDFARTVDVFQNTTGSDITTTVTIVGNLGSDAATRVFATSNGDTLVEASDQWFGTNGGPDTPSVIHYIHGPMGLQPSSVDVIGDNVTWTYTLTVYAGQTVRLAYVTIVADTEAVAIAAAETLVSDNNFGGEAAAFLTTDELHSLLNFDFATTRTWDGGGTDNNWSSPANWADDIAPVAGDLLVFAGDVQTSSNNDFPAGTMFDNITFAGDSFTLSGNSVVLSPLDGVAIANVLGQNRIELALAPESTGAVVVEAGTLELGPNAQALVLSGNGADIQGGMLVLDYMGEADPVATVVSLLTASYTAQTAITSTRASFGVRRPAPRVAWAGPTTQRPAGLALPIQCIVTQTWTARRTSRT